MAFSNLCGCVFMSIIGHIGHMGTHKLCSDVHYYYNEYNEINK
jgi:hypothetical protein